MQTGPCVWSAAPITALRHTARAGGQRVSGMRFEVSPGLDLGVLGEAAAAVDRHDRPIGAEDVQLRQSDRDSTGL